MLNLQIMKWTEFSPVFWRYGIGGGVDGWDEVRGWGLRARAVGGLLLRIFLTTKTRRNEGPRRIEWVRGGKVGGRGGGWGLALLGSWGVRNCKGLRDKGLGD